jgi:2'-5' RNA ligase
LLPPTEVADTDRAEVTAHLCQVASGHQPFELRLLGTGTFRPVTEVVFVAVTTGRDECMALESGIRRGPLDRTLQYPYHPHVTVAHDVTPEALDAAYAGLADFDERFVVDGFTLFQRGPDGRWCPERDFPFACRS